MPRKKPQSTARLSERFIFSLSPEEKAAFELAAQRQGLSLGSWLRQLARRAADMPSAGAGDTRDT